MFYKCAVNPRLWLDAMESDAIVGSADFRGALAENFAMQALCSNNLQTYYWTPPSSWKMTGELDFLLQTDRMEVVPVEVKSARNVRARTLASFMEKAGAPYAYLLSENDFSQVTAEGGAEIRQIPLYAAHCIGKGCVKAGM